VAKPISDQSSDIAGLKTRHVFMDTCEYEKYNFNVVHPTLTNLRQIADARVIQIHTTDITKNEIVRHVNAKVLEYIHHQNLRIERSKKWIDQFPTKFKQEILIDKNELLKEWLSQLDLIWLWSIDHGIESVNIAELFNSYFEKKPPFDDDDSKEFPDAAWVMMLENWCKKNDSLMYMITSDKAAGRAVSQSECLILVNNTEELLEEYNKIKNEKGVGLIKGYLNSANVIEKIKDEFNNNWKTIETDYWGEARDGKIDSMIAESVDAIYQTTVISIGNEIAECVMDVAVVLSVVIDYQEDVDDPEMEYSIRTYRDARTEYHTERVRFLVRIDTASGRVDGVEILSQFLVIS